ncbi:MAG: serine/threonine protein kinase [Acidobacteriota bacterium]|nr:serine/threonine protein kinase [Acidobacteriota bacterium]
MRMGSLLNSHIGEYQLVDFLGAGGMGEVYRAVHSKIGKVVAIKVLTLQTHGGGWHERFINEARIQARLHHPGIATLYDYSEVAGQPCILMEYVGGETLEAHIKANGSLPLSHALRIFQIVAEAISYIHQHSIIHRDIKSNNIKIGPAGEVKLLDFGIAKSASSPNLTSVGVVIGTFQYMSPEQLKGGVADARSDIWALGILFYEMIVGQVPFQSETLGTLFEQIKNGAYLRPSDFDSSLPNEVETVIARCLKKQPGQRYQSVEELLEDVRGLRDLEIDEQTKFIPDFFARVREHAKLLTVLSALVLVFSSMLYIWATSSNEPASSSSVVVVTGQPSSPSTRNRVAANRGETKAAVSDLRLVRVLAFEGEAEVYRNNERVGVTPYEVKEPLGKRVELILKRKGFMDKRVEFSVTDNTKEYTIDLARATQP